MRPRTILYTGKGGVGKTSTAVHLSGTLASMGHRVLVVDCDSQGDFSTIYVPGHESLPHSVADIFGGRLVAAFDSIPASRYDYRPTPPQQSVGHIAQHLENANYGLCERLGGAKRQLPRALVERRGYREEHFLPIDRQLGCSSRDLIVPHGPQVLQIPRRGLDW